VARRIATVSGVALVPGVSLNRRLYTREAIARMVARAQEQISGEGMNLTTRQEPLTNLTHHAAEDDSTRITGRVTSMTLAEDGSARYTADIADTEHGRTIAALVDTSDGRPAYLRNTSIRGAWVGKVRREIGPDDSPVETADDIALYGVDWTKSPGVPGAKIETFAWAKDDGGGTTEAAETDARVLITETAPEALVTFTEETPGPGAAVAGGLAAGIAAADPKATGALAELAAAYRDLLAPEPALVLRNGLGEASATVPMGKRDSGLSGGGHLWADPGYQADKKQRYDVSTKALARAAYGYICQPDNARLYTPAQLKRVKGRIIKALKGFGVTVAAEGWTIAPAWQVSESVTEWMGGNPSTAGSWCVRASNGPVTMDLSSYCMDPADLDVILRAAADAACKALAALDPDMDGDVDVPGAGPNSDPDGDAPGESAGTAAAAGLHETGSGGAVTHQTTTALTVDGALLARTVAEHVHGSTATTAPADPAAGGTDPDPDPAAEESTENPAPDPAAATPEGEEPAVSVPTNEAAGQTAAAPATETAPAAATETAAPGAVTLTSDQFAQLLAAARGPAPAAPAQESAAAAAPAPAAGQAQPAAAAAPAAVTETEEDRIARLAEERFQARVTEEVQRITQQPGGLGARKGLAAGGAVDEHTAKTAPEDGLNAHGMPASFPDKAPHDMTKTEWTQHAGTVMLGHVFRDKTRPAA
jgi:hypothetical protein